MEKHIKKSTLKNFYYGTIAYEDKEYNNINKDTFKSLPNNKFIVIHNKYHWTAVFRKNNKLYEIDSYGRDMLDSIPELYIPLKKRQGYNGDDQSCGQRTLAILHSVFKN